MPQPLHKMPCSIFTKEAYALRELMRVNGWTSKKMSSILGKSVRTIHAYIAPQGTRWWRSIPKDVCLKIHKLQKDIGAKSNSRYISLLL